MQAAARVGIFGGEVVKQEVKDFVLDTRYEERRLQSDRAELFGVVVVVLVWVTKQESRIWFWFGQGTEAEFRRGWMLCDYYHYLVFKFMMK